MKLVFLFLCALLSATGSANKGERRGLRVATRSSSLTLQPWLVGLTAVVGFLFIVFVVLIVHRLLKKNRKGDEGLSCDHKVLEMEEADVKQTSF